MVSSLAALPKAQSVEADSDFAETTNTAGIPQMIIPEPSKRSGLPQQNFAASTKPAIGASVRMSASLPYMIFSKYLPSD